MQWIGTANGDYALGGIAMTKTSRVIRIDGEVFAALQARAIDNLRDTPNKVLRRVLGLDPTQHRDRTGEIEDD